MLLFSPNKHQLVQFVAKHKEKIETKGIEFNGPHPLSKIKSRKLVAFLYHIKYPNKEETLDEKMFPDWLFDAVASDENHEALVKAAEEGSTLHGRQFDILGENNIRPALSFDLPDLVFATVQIGNRALSKGKGKDPYTWDPNIDNVPSHPGG